VQTSQTLYSLWFGKGEQERGERSSFMNNQMTENAKRHCLKLMFQAVPLGEFTLTQGGRKWNNQK